jgi:hypothetical protein
MIYLILYLIIGLCFALRDRFVNARCPIHIFEWFLSIVAWPMIVCVCLIDWFHDAKL